MHAFMYLCIYKFVLYVILKHISLIRLIYCIPFTITCVNFDLYHTWNVKYKDQKFNHVNVQNVRNKVSHVTKYRVQRSRECLTIKCPTQESRMRLTLSQCQAQGK